MRLVIIDDYKLTKFDLPKEGHDYFLVPYKFRNDSATKYLNVEYSDNAWVFRSNSDINIINNGMILNSLKLEVYTFYKLEVLPSRTPIYLYCASSEEEFLGPFDVQTMPTINIGKDVTNDITYSDFSTMDKHATITRDNTGKAIISAVKEKNPIYINDFRVVSSELRVGDTIFINGLKIIWMDKFIKVNNPNGQVHIAKLGKYLNTELKTSTYEPVHIDLSEIELYKPTDYFYHTPRLKNVLEEEIIKIDVPPASEQNEQLPLMLSLGSSITMGASSLMMGYTIISSVQSGKKTVADSLTQIITCASMIVGSLIMPRLTDSYQKHRKNQKERLRQKKYTKYLNDKNQKIQTIIANQIQTMNDNYLTPANCHAIITSKNRRLWERKIEDDDFLEISLGKGNIDAKLTIEAPDEHFTLEEDNLIDKVHELVNSSKTLENVPITVNLTKERVMAITGSTLDKSSYIDGILLEFMTFHSSSELKIVFITDEEGNKKYNYVKYLPHLWSDDKKSRYYATNIDEAKNIMTSLEAEFKSRVEKMTSNSASDNELQIEELDRQNDYKNFDTYYLIISDTFKTIRDLPLVENILKSTKNYGFSMLLIESSMKDLPSECETFAYISDTDSCLFSKTANASSQKKFLPDTSLGLDMNMATKILANIPVEVKSAEQMLPTSLTFLDMMKVSKIEQLNILSRWKENDPTKSLQTPIGVHKNGETFYLNLHEKAHGPHGLIAGSTGSGKSEFIITMVLSLALNYSPEELQFVLIDYKGGGLAGAFENREKGYRIPHLAGTITNLDTSAMNRTLVSINSELKRRQKKFNEVRDRLGEGTIDIYKYQRLYRDGVIDEPISHLLIICDEFAELKSQRPEFMNELISTSRIGRSLGVHLILATQKPTGVVNDQIWANSKFKICLKVQDRSDSMGMLKKPDAASIKETGRFYLQVGYDEYFDIGQSGWSGAKYVPSDTVKKKLDDSINFLDNEGNIMRSINDAIVESNEVSLGDQLTNCVKYLIDLADKAGVKRSQLWLDNIPDEIFIQGLTEKYNYKAEPFNINPLIGEYDFPANQEQGMLTLDLTNKGNTLIYGMPGSGKENLLYTVITSTSITHTPEEVNFYILDFGAETLKMFAKFPHVGDVSLLDDQEKIMNTFILLDEEMDKRKELFADYAGSYTNYIKMSNQKLPLIVTIINAYEVFAENYSKLSEVIQPLIRDGAKYGIVFIITTSTSNAIRARMLANFGNVMSLQQQNPADYRNLLGAPKELLPTKAFGRGIVKHEKGVLEFQSAFICEREQITDMVKNIREKLEEMYPNYKVRNVPVMPKVITIEDVKDKITSLNDLPIGMDESTKDIATFDFEKNVVTSIVANKIDEHMPFINSLIREILLLKDVDVKVVDISNIVTAKIKGMAIAKARFEVALKELIKEINDSPNNKITSIYIFTGIGEIKNHLNEEGIALFNSIFSNVKKFMRTKIILIDNYASYKKIQVEPWYNTAINTTSGIWLGEGIGIQLAINYTQITDEARKASFDHMGFIITDGNPKLVKCITEKEEDKK